MSELLSAIRRCTFSGLLEPETQQVTLLIRRLWLRSFLRTGNLEPFHSSSVLCAHRHPDETTLVLSLLHLHRIQP